jgi:hypothetical protein
MHFSTLLTIVHVALLSFSGHQGPQTLLLWICGCGDGKSEVYKEKVNTRDELVAHIMNSAALLKQEHQDDIRIIKTQHNKI